MTGPPPPPSPGAEAGHFAPLWLRTVIGPHRTGPDRTGPELTRTHGRLRARVPWTFTPRAAVARAPRRDGAVR